MLRLSFSTPNPRRRCGRLLSLVLACGPLLAATSASAQIRTVLVSPTPGNPTASGTTLRNALAAIASPSSTNPWLVKVEPGIYDIGNTSLPMRAWVDIEGSGIGVTTIQGSVDASSISNAGTINGADNAELRDLTVKATAAGAVVYVIAVYNPAASPRLYRVKLVATGQIAWGLRTASGAPRIEEVEITSTGSAAAYGMVFSAAGGGLPAGRTSILRSKITVSGASVNFGIFMTGGSILTEIRDSRIDVVGGSTTYGLYGERVPGWPAADNLVLRNTDVISGGASATSYGVFFDFGVNIYLSLDDSRVWGHVAPNAYGIVHRGGNAVVAQGSSLVGATAVAEVVGNASIASTSLNGGPITVTGWLGCMGVWDESAVFYANTCPP